MSFQYRYCTKGMLNGNSFEWTGRQLESISGNGNTNTYKYNANGIHTEKTVNGVTTKYFIEGDRIVLEKVGNEERAFWYDGDGKAAAFTIYDASGMHPYYYIRNAQKDIIGLFDANGTIVARYAYDSWGNLLKITDGSGNDKTNDTAFVGYKNPLRYRGYYYDSETKLYYLQSRYYNPEWGRFINADGFISTGQGLISTNMFAYCNNNPAMFADPTGYCAKCRVSSYNAATMPWSAWERHMAMYPELIATVGSAKPYQSVSGGSNTPNCYAYAIGVSNALNPGNISGASPTKWNDVNDMASSVMADIEKMGRSVRKIDSYNSTIYNNEYRIALRVGTQPYGYYYGSPIYDYHLMVETSSGQWAEKHGTGGSSLIWAQGYNPTTIPWTIIINHIMIVQLYILQLVDKYYKKFLMEVYI